MGKFFSLFVFTGLLLLPAVSESSGVRQNQSCRASNPRYQQIFETASARSDFPFFFSEAVCRQMHTIMSSAQERDALRAAFSRLNASYEMFSSRFREYSLPEELLSVAVVESRVINVGPGRSHGDSAGIWQFVSGTARAMGLRVGRGADERMSPERSTDAAARYFALLNSRFGNWHHVLIGYNRGDGGAGTFISGISRRPAAQAETILQNESYLAKVTSTAIFFRVPEALE